jgi:hypothetical protein
MDRVERRVSVERARVDERLLFQVTIEGFDPILLPTHWLGHLFGVLFGSDASFVFRDALDGRMPIIYARPWLDEAQLAALEAMLAVYRREAA